MRNMIPLLVTSVALAACMDAQADSFGFSQLSNNAGIDISDQLKVDVEQDAGKACFTFRNLGPISSAISGIYFDDAPPGVGNADGYLGDMVYIDSGWTAYTGSPSDLPGGNTAVPPFTTAGDPIQYATADSSGGSPINSTTIGPEESLKICFTYKNGGGIDDVIADLLAGALRIGLKVQSIGTSGQSDAYITGGAGTSVPDGGATILLLGLGLIALGIGGTKSLKWTRS